jgi:hypothetical protein
VTEKKKNLLTSHLRCSANAASPTRLLNSRVGNRLPAQLLQRTARLRNAKPLVVITVPIVEGAVDIAVGCLVVSVNTTASFTGIAL